MMNGGEAADQMVSYAFKGGEVILRLTGDGAKHLAIYLANLLKQGGPSKGRTTLNHMIADGKELSVQRIDISQIPYFNARAKKYGVMFVAVRDTKAPDGKCDIMFRTEDAARVKRIFDCLAISERPDVAHIKSDTLRAKGKDPTQARKGAGVPPSAPASPGSGNTGKNRASVRGQLHTLRRERADAPAAAGKAPRGRKGKGR